MQELSVKVVLFALVKLVFLRELTMPFLLFRATFGTKHILIPHPITPATCRECCVLDYSAFCTFKEWHYFLLTIVTIPGVHVHV